MKKLYVFLLSCFLAGSIQAQTNVTFFTTEGRFVVEIYDNIVPITGGNFLGLVNQKFYDGIIFHRVINNFVIQGGDPTGTGTGGSGTIIPDEFDSSLSNIQKSLSMANSGPNTGTSQFFINLVNNTQLDFDKPPSSSKHPVFGMVIENFNVVQAIGAVQVGAQSKPIVPVVMDSIRVGDNIYAGLQEKHSLSNLRIIPNPSEGISGTFLRINTLKSGNAFFSLFDSQGRQITTNTIGITEGSNHILLSDYLSSDLPSGMYFLNFSLDGEVQNQTMLIK